MGDTILLSHIGVEVRSSWKVQFQSVCPGQSTIYHRALLDLYAAPATRQRRLFCGAQLCAPVVH